MPSVSALPRCEGNISPALPDNAEAAFNTSTACPESGTRCSRPFFMRVSGMIQVAESTLISAQSASLTSLLRVAVKVKNSKAAFVAGHALLSRTAATAAPTLGYSKAG